MTPVLESEIFHKPDMNTITHNMTGEPNPGDAVKALKAVHELLNLYFSKGTPSDKEPASAVQTKHLELQPGAALWRANDAGIQPSNGSLTAAHHATTITTNGAEQAKVPEPEFAGGRATTSAGSTASKAGSPDGAAAELRALADQISRNIDALSAVATAEAGPGGASKAQDMIRLKVVASVTELMGAIRPPQDTIMNWFAQASIVSVVRVFQHWHLFDAMPAEKGASIAISELAEKVGAEESLLVRMSWMLTSSDILRYIPSSATNPTPRLAHTPASLLLREASPMASMFKLMFTNVVEASTIMPSYFDTYGKIEPIGPTHIPTSVLAGNPELTNFEVLNENQDKVKDFMHAMSITHRRSPITGMYDLSWVIEQAAALEKNGDKRPVWVDVGGSSGNVIKVFREANPGLKGEWCVVQDLPEVLEAAEEAAKNDEALKGVQWIPLDFHTQSPVKGAVVYYLRHIVRDYSDPVTVQILSNIRQSMAPASANGPASRILISEQLTTAPPPLYAAFKDYAMLAISGKERTIDNFKAVADAAGLQVTGVYRDKDTPHAVVEMQLKTEVGVANGHY